MRIGGEESAGPGDRDNLSEFVCKAGRLVVLACRMRGCGPGYCAHIYTWHKKGEAQRFVKMKQSPERRGVKPRRGIMSSLCPFLGN